MLRTSTITLIALCASAAMAATVPALAQSTSPQPPLAGLAAQPILVFPAHFLRGGDTIAWASSVTDPRGYLAQFDSTLESILKERGIPSSWSFPSQLRRSAQRNAGYVANPYQLAAHSLRYPARAPKEQLPDPLASQLRAWVALQNAQLAIIPVEIRFEGQKESAVAVLRVVIVDARRASVSWLADVRGDSAPSPVDGAVASLARHVANLVIAP